MASRRLQSSSSGPSHAAAALLRVAATPFQRVFVADPVAVSAIHWDVIIVGGGFGGGTLANVLTAPLQLKDGAQSQLKRVLLVERGDLLFPTHVLNTAGTVVHFHAKGSTQINDVVPTRQGALPNYLTYQCRPACWS